MFENIAEQIYCYLSRKELVSQRDKEVYTYALEIIVMNLTLLIVLFVISVFLKQLMFFVCYMVFFVPMRIFSGGYHAKKSETCFLMSVLIYLLALFILKSNIHLYENIAYGAIASLILLILYIFSPLENVKHPLSKQQKDRNKRIVRIMVFIDFTLLFIFAVNGITLASYEMVFVVLNGLLFLVGKCENFYENSSGGKWV